MQIATHHKDKTISVKYFPDHAGHEDSNPLTTRMPSYARKKLVKDLVRGVEEDIILRKFKKLPFSTNIKKRLLKRRQLKNLKYHLTPNEEKRIYDGRYHDSDLVSCRISLGYLKKQKGLFYDNLDTVEDLKDAVIIIADEFQLKCLKKYGSDKICMDSTFGCNGYGLKTTAIVVVNEFGQGMPVVYIISNKLTTEMWKFCLSKIKEAVGEAIVPETFMSDNDPTYYNAWVDVMGKPKNRLLCTWHLTKAWAKHVDTIPLQNRRGVLGQLMGIKKTLDKKKFKTLLFKLKRECVGGRKWNPTKAKTVVKKPCQEKAVFWAYFQKYYLNRVHEWADCYRIALGLTTNNYVESQFNYFKNVDRKIKKNIRLDILITKIIETAEHHFTKYYDNIMAGRGFKDTYNNKTHKDATASKPNYEKKRLSWVVKSNFITHKVTKGQCLNCECMNKCLTCGVCINILQCDCSAYRVNGNICQGMHAVCLFDIEFNKNVKLIGTNAPAVSEYHFEDKSTEEDTVDYVMENEILLRVINDVCSTKGNHAKELNKDMKEFYNKIKKYKKKEASVNPEVQPQQRYNTKFV